MDSTPGRRNGRKIVVGFDGSEPSGRALRFAAALAEDLRDAELIVVFVRHIYLCGPDLMDEAMFSDVLDHVERTARGLADKELCGRSFSWQFETCEGDPARLIMEAADRVGALMIVAGRSGWSTLHELLLGSVSNRLAHHAGRPVLLVS